jgi:hypothetical protein
VVSLLWVRVGWDILTHSASVSSSTPCVASMMMMVQGGEGGLWRRRC